MKKAIKEKKYYVFFKNTNLISTSEVSYLTRSRGIFTAENMAAAIDEAPMYTEAEIKAIDERFWAFAVEVEE